MEEFSLKRCLDLCRVEEALRTIVEDGAQAPGGLIDLWIARPTVPSKMMFDLLVLVHRPELMSSELSLQLKVAAI